MKVWVDGTISEQRRKPKNARRNMASRVRLVWGVKGPERKWNTQDVRISNVMGRRDGGARG